MKLPHLSRRMALGTIAATAALPSWAQTRAKPRTRARWLTPNGVVGGVVSVAPVTGGNSRDRSWRRSSTSGSSRNQATSDPVANGQWPGEVILVWIRAGCPSAGAIFHDGSLTTKQNRRGRVTSAVLIEGSRAEEADGFAAAYLERAGGEVERRTGAGCAHG